MERLTERAPKPSVNSQYVKRKGFYTADCIERLGMYEDTGLTPEEIVELKERDTAMEINEIHVDEYYCPACGAENNCDQGVVEDYFCPRCGQRLKEREN